MRVRRSHRRPDAALRSVYRPPAARASAVLWVVLAVGWAFAVAGTAEPVIIARQVPSVLLVTVLAWAVLWRPAVLVDDDAVTLRNVLRDVTVPWAALDDVQTRWALTLLAGGRRYLGWAAPAPGRGLLAQRGRRDVPWVQPAAGGPASVAASEQLDSESGAAAFLVRQRWRARRGHLGGRNGSAGVPMPARCPSVAVRWTRPVLAALTCSLSLAVMAGVFSGG